MDIFQNSYLKKMMDTKVWDDCEKKFKSLYEYRTEYEENKISSLYDTMNYSNTLFEYFDERTDLEDYTKQDLQWFEEVEKLEEELNKDFEEQLALEAEFEQECWGKSK